VVIDWVSRKLTGDPVKKEGCPGSVVGVVVFGVVVWDSYFQALNHWNSPQNTGTPQNLTHAILFFTYEKTKE
jgi:hypothetical protein